jgi:hypothetical protein
MITQENLDYLFSIKKDEEDMETVIYTLFNKKKATKPDGTTYVAEPMFYPWEAISLKGGQLENLKEDIQSTVGIYIFNLLFLVYPFGSVISYMNETINKKKLENILNTLSDLLLMDKITSEQFAQFEEQVIWFNNFTEILIPGVTPNLLVLPDEIRKELDRLVKENKVAIDAGDIVTYVNNVEKPILAFAEAWYKKNDPSGWQIYGLRGKPKFENNFKNMFLEVGPIKDIVSGKYKISTSSLSDGIPPEEYAEYGNSAVAGSYSRGVSTQYAGAKTKEFSTAFESLVIEPGSDCGTKRTIPITISEDNLQDMKWRWIIEPGKEGLTLLTPDNIGEYMGKTVNCRTALFCASDNLCEKCSADLYRRINITNSGLTLGKLTSTFLNVFLKKMHDSTIQTSRFDPFDYLYELK